MVLAVLGMGAHAVVTLIAAALAIAVTAMYLIKIVFILWTVISRLYTILDAVVAVTEKSQPAGPVLADIKRDLDAARRAMEGAVQRLEQRTAAPAAVAAPPAAAAAEPAASEPPPSPGGSAGGRGWWNR